MSYLRIRLVLFVTLITAVFTITALADPLPTPPPLDERSLLPRLMESSEQPTQLAQMPAPNLITSWSKITFQSYRDQHWDIYSGNDDGNNQIRLTNYPGPDIHPRFNRGATRIVYSSYRSGDYELYIMNADGSEQTPLTNNETDDVNPVWSFDNSKIAYQSYQDGQSEIYVMNADGSGVTRLTNYGGYDGYPTWSPDGSRLAFVSDRAGGYYIYVMNADGSNVTQLSTQSSSFYPTWSPDGSWIAYSADGNGDGWLDLWLMNADGSNQLSVYMSTGLQDAWARSWSPDGRYIAFTLVWYTYYQGNWYWVNAYTDALSLSNPNPFQLSQNGLDWNPDWQTTDILAPSASIKPLPSVSPGPIPVRWSGSDTGAGIKSYDVQVRVGNNNTWTDWLVDTPATSGSYPGISGETYHFRIRARDNAFNLGTWSEDTQVSTTVETIPPQTSVFRLPPFQRVGNLLIVFWGGYDPGNSGIASYELQYRRGNGVWTDWHIEHPETQSQVWYSGGEPGESISFRSRAIDHAQNQEEWPDGEGDTQTTYYLWGISGTAYDNAGTPISGIETNISPGVFANPANSSKGEYAAYSLASSDPYTVTWSHPGLGSLPATAFAAEKDAVLDVYLPPTDDLWVNGDFENGFLSTQYLTNTQDVIITDTNHHTGNYALFMGSIGGFFDPLQQISTALESAVYPQTALDNSGNLHVIWRGGYGTKSHIYYTYRGSTGVWSTPQNISSNIVWVRDPRLTIINNIIHVTFQAHGDGKDTFYYTYKSVDGTWSTPYLVNGSIGSDEYQFTVGNNGDTHFIWRQQGIRIMYYSRHAANGTWDTPYMLTPFPNADGSVAFPDIVTDSHNNVHMVWYCHDAGYGGFARIDFVTRRANGEWIYHDPVISADRDEYSYLKLIIDKADHLHLIWHDEIAESTSAPDDKLLYYANYNGSYWSTPLPLIIADYIRDVNFISDEVGNLYLVLSSLKYGSPYSILYLQRHTNGIWDTPITIYQDADASIASIEPVLLVDHEQFYIAWTIIKSDTYFSQILLSQRTNGNNWSDPIMIPPTLDQSQKPCLNLDQDNRLHIIWQDGYKDQDTNIPQIYHTAQRLAETSEDLSYSQSISLPVNITNTVISYVYQLTNSAANDGVGLFVEVTDSNNTTTIASHVVDDKWAHNWVNLNNWIGKRITVTFRLHLEAGLPLPQVYLDDLSVGSAHPDVWVTGTNNNAILGDNAMFIITYGNRGGAPAPGTLLTMTLPVEITFSETNLTPISTDPLVWDIGTLPAKSEPITFVVTGTINANTPTFTTSTSIVKVSTSSEELETLNNTVEIATYIGRYSYLPIIARP